jgi:predicted alpha-1,2-mannosidase
VSGIALCTLLAAGSLVGTSVRGRPAGAATSVALVRNPSSLVRPIDGTGTGPVNPGTVGEFPGADVPFGMLQWSPDTVPNAVQSGGGYAHADSHINGFSLTHLSGTGCPSYQDIPILPTVGPIGTSPAATTDTFSHALERASPGRYAVVLGPAGIATSLAVTTRSGISSFTFPASQQANLLFKVSGSINPVSASAVHVIGHDELTGQVTSGQFCQTGTNYTVFFVARFSRPFASAGTWESSSVSPTQTSCSGATCGAYVTFDTESQRSVLMKVGISFVSVHNAEANLEAEDPGWSVHHVAQLAQSRWNTLLRRIDIGGGTLTQRRIFYTALYHSLLFPNVVSDENGQYIGEDGKLHGSRTREHYANFSEWDIYRGEIQLESLLAPHQVGDMIQSLVDDEQQEGWLPKWAIVDGDESQINGDSADPIIADAYAFGIRNFDVKAALAAMVKGATQNESGHGLEIERQYLSQYLSQHYVNAGSLDLTSIDYSIGGSVTLEYALDDFSIAQIAAAQHDHALYADMMRRAHNWEYEFNPSTGYMQARNTDGSFDPGPAFQTSLLEPGGETGFEEGNAIQYTWAVPQDLAALASLMGGDGHAVAKLNTFFTQLNATRNLPYDWAGNEPSLWSPWEYDYFGAPSRTQGVVRQIVNTLYADAPVDEPGNDDLGAIASWYVWAAIGLYPVTPGTANLALGSPLFPQVRMTLPDGHALVLHAPAASATTPYVHSLRVSGVAHPVASGPMSNCAASEPIHVTADTWDLPWLPASVIRSGATLDDTLSDRPDPSWDSSPDASPPSFGEGLLPAIGFSFPSGATSVEVGQSAPIQIGVAAAGTDATSVDWNVVPGDGGVAVAGTSGVLTLPSAGSPADESRSCSPPVATHDLVLTGLTPGSYAVDIDLATPAGVHLPPIVLDVHVTGQTPTARGG